jgi:hypothetical protein
MLLSPSQLKPNLSLTLVNFSSPKNTSPKYEAQAWTEPDQSPKKLGPAYLDLTKSFQAIRPLQNNKTC